MPELLTRLALRGARRPGDGVSMVVEVSFVAIVALLVVAGPC